MLEGGSRDCVVKFSKGYKNNNHTKQSREWLVHFIQESSLKACFYKVSKEKTKNTKTTTKNSMHSCFCREAVHRCGSQWISLWTGASCSFSPLAQLCVCACPGSEWRYQQQNLPCLWGLLFASSVRRPWARCEVTHSSDQAHPWATAGAWWCLWVIPSLGHHCPA